MKIEEQQYLHFAIVAFHTEGKNMDNNRIRFYQDGVYNRGPVIYWMRRDQRTADNWALIIAQGIAIQRRVPLCVVFNLIPEYLGAGRKQYNFMIRGLRETANRLKSRNIYFELLQGQPEETLFEFSDSTDGSLLITDFDPLRIKSDWLKNVGRFLKIPIFEVDAHNIIPCWKTSSELEYSVQTIRPKIKNSLDEYLCEFPEIRRHPFKVEKRERWVDWEELISFDSYRCLPGEEEAMQVLASFIGSKLKGYSANRNDPAAGMVSDLSPYFHFGQLSAQRAALAVIKSGAPEEDKEAFLEELIVRRELADNWCYYNSLYDNFEGFPEWSKKTLNDHRNDKREYLYTVSQWENAETHDRLWNAAQNEMVKTGKMHGYMRMYWAKKILEWSESPEEALDTAIYLNDKYSLDGRDPNGYTGIAWAIGGVHDRAWRERPVFGKIRYMNENGCKRKFDTNSYIERIEKI